MTGVNRGLLSKGHLMLRLFSTILGLGLLATVAAAPPASAAESRVDLAGVTVLEGSQTAVIPVRLDRDAELLNPVYFPGQGVIASGDSPLVGFALVSDQPEPEVVLVGGLLPWKVDNPRATVTIPLTGVDFGDRFNIPAGDYRLYLITDGEPGRVTLELGGLSGERVLRPQQPVPYALKMPESRSITTPTGENFHVNGDHADLQSNGLIFSSDFTIYTKYLSSRSETCFYDRATTESDFGPGCLPDGFGSAFVINDFTTLTDRHGRYSYGGYPGLTPGTYGVGQNQQDVGEVEEFSTLTLWLSYEQPALPPAPRSTGTFCAAVAADYQPFSDIGGNTFEPVIECAAFAGLARGGPAGLSADRYGPGLLTNRAQMASLVARMIDTADRHDNTDAVRALPPYDGTPAFTDVPSGSAHFQAVHRLEQAGIVTGGPGGRLPTEYGPDLPVSREQMATFLNRAVGFMTGTPLTTGQDYFGDDEDSVHEDNINGVASAGIAVGDGARTFSPRREIPRDQVSAFLMRGLALLHDDGDIRAAERN
jgi:hypothetical protein